MNVARNTLYFVAVVSCLGCIRISNHSFHDDRVIGSGVAKSEDRPVEPFKKIEIIGSADVTVSVGAPLQVSVHADDNILPLVETQVSGDRMVINTTKSYSSNLGVEVKCSVPELSEVSISGSGNIRASNVGHNSLSIAISGSGNVDATEVANDSTRVEISGSGSAKASGATQKVDVSISGSGSAQLRDLEAKMAAVSIPGSGDATINAADQLSISISGSGSVTYKGAPKVDQNISGSGTVRQSN